MEVFEHSVRVKQQLQTESKFFDLCVMGKLSVKNTDVKHP